MTQITVLNPKVIEDLFSADLAYLQDLYLRINDQGHNRLSVTCPSCETSCDVAEERPGG